MQQFWIMSGMQWKVFCLLYQNEKNTIRRPAINKCAKSTKLHAFSCAVRCVGTNSLKNQARDVIKKREMRGEVGKITHKKTDG